jgi:hypothetical protein
VQARVEVPDRPIPFTYERALTELAGCRRDLSSARGSLELVVEILGRLGADVEDADLEEILGRLEEAEMLLVRTMPRGPA